MSPTHNNNYQWPVSVIKYNAVLGAALETAKVILTHPSKNNGTLDFVVSEAERLLQDYPTHPLNDSQNKDEIVFDIFKQLREAWPLIVAGQIRFDQYLGKEGNLWERFMTEFPLGEYAKMAAHILRSENLLEGEILELGAGVGNTSRLVAPFTAADKYLRTDLNIKLLKSYPHSSKISFYDFNRPGRWKNLSCVFAVNALHCSKDKQETLKFLYDMLAPGGTLLFAEGAPSPLPGHSWALTYLCGFFEGWWDQGGFLTREVWFHFLEEAGFKDIQFSTLTAGPNDLGGVIWAKKI